MRAAEILVEMLLAEASTVVAAAWGPDLPTTGRYFTGKTLNDIWKSARASIIGPKSAYKLDDLIHYWLIKKYSFLVRLENGSFRLYGNPVQLDEENIFVFGIKSGTPVEHVTRTSINLSMRMSNAALTLGVT